ncbi:MAG TPA: nuclear transport factor 2 family protein [Candidatus Acidoferrum sp.]|nr:nuclear transport factor 2 family protein [Candidatus Acidoferrum sp.]
MKTRASLPKILGCLMLLVMCGAPLRAQAIQSLDEIKSQADLDKTIAALDAALFDAYNHCDLEKFASFVADDIEFYHDKGGVTLGKQAFVDSIKKNICGTDVRRELVPGTLRAHYMKGYGAIEIGTHRFFHPKTNIGTGEAEFVTLWQYKDGAWKMTRALSFDHHEAAK